ncbi:MAG TPA: hypothetical protein PKD51_19270 [Saprospiraceae bacterium]|nr:hypothetical protein [Saprospiraceae bacterium]
MKKILNIPFYIFLAVLFSQCASNKLSKIVADGIEASIELERDTFLLGEPFYVTFTIFNGSKIDVEIDQCKDSLLGGRLDNFDIKIINEHQDTSHVDRVPNTYEKDKFDILYATSSQKYQLFIPRWSAITKPGKYQIVVTKDIKISTQIRHVKNDKSMPKALKVITKEADASFIIIKDSVRLGKYINNLIEEIEAETEGRIVSYLGIEEGEESNIPMSKNLFENMEKLDELTDERIIPFLIRSYKYNMNLPRYRILHLLRKFAYNDSVYELLKIAANDICNCDDKNYNIHNDRDIRQLAISIIISKNTDDALQFLLSKGNIDCFLERYWILLIAKNPFDKERLIKLCEAYQNDENKYVREKAIEILNEIKSE